jgi:hypothetical protein
MVKRTRLARPRAFATMPQCGNEHSRQLNEQSKNKSERIGDLSAPGHLIGAAATNTAAISASLRRRYFWDKPPNH